MARPRDPKWAALRRWHREQESEWLAIEAKWMQTRGPYSHAADYAKGKAVAHKSALTKMTRLTRAASRKGKR